MAARPMFLGRLALLACLAASTVHGAAAAASASISHREGSLVYAPAGATEWALAPAGREVARGDRLWTDPGARAEVHLGGGVLHLDSEAFLEVAELDAGVFLGQLHEGSVLARVRALAPGDQVEIATPHLSVRLLRAGSYRIEVDARRGTSRLTVREGHAFVRPHAGGARAVRSGEQMEWNGRWLEVTVAPAEDRFEQWSARRIEAQAQRVAATAEPGRGPAPAAPAGQWVWDGLRWAWRPLTPARGPRGEADGPRARWEADQAQHARPAPRPLPLPVWR